MNNKDNYTKLLITIEIALILTLVWLIKQAQYFFNIAVLRNEKEELQEMFNLSEELNVLKNVEKKEGKILKEWSAKTPQKSYHILSHDSIALYGLAYVQREYTNKWAIVVHGYCGYGMQMNNISKQFYEEGFNVLVPDLRAHGESDGDYIGFGWHDRLDIIAWANKIIKGDPNSSILLYGLSMGGATVLMCSGESLPPNIKCIVEDCGYTSLVDEFTYHLKKTYKLPKFPLLNLTQFICRHKTGFTFKEASAINQVKKCKIPILFIHGENDNLVPTEMVFKLFKAANCKKEIFIVPKAGHGVSASVGKDLYFEKIISFSKKYCS